jgi:hypothetical protein
VAVTPQQAETIQVLTMVAVTAEVLPALEAVAVLADILEMVAMLLFQAAVKLDLVVAEVVAGKESPELLVAVAVVA